MSAYIVVAMVGFALSLLPINGLKTIYSGQAAGEPTSELIFADDTLRSDRMRISGHNQHRPDRK